MAEVAAWLAIGAATGFFAGLLGIGGGTILVSSLALMFAAQGIPAAHVMHMAIGTSLAAIMAGAWASFGLVGWLPNAGLIDPVTSGPSLSWSPSVSASVGLVPRVSSSSLLKPSLSPLVTPSLPSCAAMFPK